MYQGMSRPSLPRSDGPRNIGEPIHKLAIGCPAASLAGWNDARCLARLQMRPSRECDSEGE
jgi:hypothetical protein